MFQPGATPSIDIFAWAPWFNTGLSAVDEQHLQLVALLNTLSRSVFSGAEVDVGQCERALGELESYAAYHFHEEHREMQQAHLDLRHITPHLTQHRDFVSQVKSFSLGSSVDPLTALPKVLRFVTGWLTLHILETDQSMARQIRAIHADRSAAEAFEADLAPRDPSVQALLDAVHSLHGLLSRQNIELASANLLLESRVIERTAELKRANEELLAAAVRNRSTQDQLLHAEKMAAVGQLAAGVAHELNNPLSYISANLIYLGEELAVVAAASSQGQVAAPEGSAPVNVQSTIEELQLVVAESKQGADRARDIVTDLLQFSRSEGSAWQPANLEKLLDSTVRMARNQLTPDTVIERNYGGIPEVECQPGRIHQVFLNLLVNAAQSIAGAGRIILRTVQQNPGEIWIEVEDTGCGISPAAQERLFEPFFTTKPVGRGTGLGLSTAYAIVQRHQGRIEVKSVVGAGTRVRLVLPVRHAKQAGD